MQRPWIADRGRLTMEERDSVVAERTRGEYLGLSTGRRQRPSKRGRVDGPVEDFRVRAASRGPRGTPES